jgi:cytochrome c oxidase subunit II
MKYIYGLGLIVVLLLAGCSSASDNAGITTAEDAVVDAGSDATVADSAEIVALPVPVNEVVQETVVVSGSSPVKSFEMIAKQWEFLPDTITVNKGDTVHISVKSIDVAHGFALPDFGVNEYLSPGKTVDVEFVADKTGTFTFFCSVQCGSGHSDMSGKLVVEERV